ncbi:cyanophycinase [Luteimonas padinae]|uniref:Cyanophycinase n=1 Tax=Luteimonas padinae TaxID=1714359 RepID=A0ABV6SWB6_9GAMM|nr:cyanophycinase [Luteimonas padinae]GHD72004.1 cyanophycinase [Luteimonas padinae]
MPSKPVNGEQRGWIIPIGGAEDKDTNPRILARFVELSGGGDADIVVIPTASRLKDSGLNYQALFRGMGVERVDVMDFDTRRDCQEPGRIQRLSEASGIFLTGGNQLRLSTILGGTDVARTLRLCNARGVTVAGTSAGAGFLSEHMIAFGKEGSSPRASSVRLAPGLGLTNRFVIDQHFRQRDRLGRLTAALAYNPFAIGIGLDEDTAAFISPDDTLEVEGSGAVTVVDAHDLQFSSMAHADEDDPVCMLGLGVHILIAGATFNLHTRRASAGRLATRKT